MDPLSATLSVISLMTTVKEIVGLGQKIQKSFAKVSDNLRNARRVAEDVKEMVEEIEAFCRDHEDVLDNMKDFRLALQGLLIQFQIFETSILPLITQVGGSRRRRLFRGWEAWRKSDKIEGHILELQGDIMKVMRRYVMKSTMRAEVKLEKMHQDTNGGLAGISQDLERVRRDVSIIRITTTADTRAYGPYKTSASASDELDRQIVTFAHSTSRSSTPLLRTPDVVTEDLMTRAYIKLQINHIVGTLDKISKLPAPTLNDIDNFHMYPSMTISMGTTDLQHFGVRQVLEIRNLLNTGNTQAISIRQGASALNVLSLGLGALQMGPESIQISKWATELDHLLVVSSGGHPDLSATLALHLSNQSVQYYNNGDKAQSLQAIQKAHKIAVDLRAQSNREVRFQILYSHVSLHYSPLVDTQRSIEMLAEVVEILEDVLNIHEFTQPRTPDRLKAILQSSSPFLNRLFSSSLPIITTSNYALALQRLGTCLFMAGQRGRAVDLLLLAIAVRRQFVFVHGHQYKANLAKALLSLVQNEIAKNHISAEVLVNLAEEGVHLFHELAEYNPTSYARQLIDILCAKARILDNSERYTEALATWENAVSLASQCVEDSRLYAATLGSLANHFRRLKRHDDAARTVTLAINAYSHEHEVQAVRYALLSKDLGWLRRYKESAEAAQMAVELYRYAAMRGSESRMGALTTGLANLAHHLAASGDCSRAMRVWKESVGLLENFLRTNPDASSSATEKYRTAISAHIQVSNVLEDGDDILQVSFTAVRHCRQSLETFSQAQNSGVSVELLWAEFYHAYNLLRVGRLQDAHQYIKDWIELWSGKTTTNKGSEILRWRAVMMGLKCSILDARGDTEEALLINQRIYDAVRPSSSAYQPSFAEMIKAMICSVQLQVVLGKSAEALNVAEDALQLSRENKLEPSVPPLVRSLHGVASTALFRQDYKRAMEAAKEGYDLSASPSWQDGEREHSILIRPSLLAIWSSAEVNLDQFDSALKHAKDAVDVSLDIRDMKLYISATTAEQSYMETQGNLAEVLLVSGDLVQARQICEERRAYFSKRVDTRMAEYRDLAPVLRMLGILYCSEGRHEEGNDAAQELIQIMKTSGSVSSSVQEQVKTRLRHQARVPILEVLDDMCRRLDCKHHTEVALLVSI